jgi:hypothetical protein
MKRLKKLILCVDKCFYRVYYEVVIKKINRPIKNIKQRMGTNGK